MSEPKTVDPLLTDPELRFYYYGFLRVLRRHRLMTVVGWFVVAMGFVGLLLAWSLDLPHGFIDLVLALLAMLSGILVVQQSVAALQEYVSIPFSHRQPAAEPVLAILVIMDEIRRGGWREAAAGISKMEAIAGQYGFADRSEHVSQIFQER